MLARLFIPLLLCAGPAPLAFASGQYVWEGFEREINWVSFQHTAATGRALDDEQCTEGNHSLKLMFRCSADSGRASFCRWQYMDWSRFGALLLDIYNPTGLENLRVGVDIVTTERNLAHEFITGPLKPGWNRDVRVPLKKPVFSSMSSDYKPVGYLAGRGEINSVTINVYPGAPFEGSVSVDNVRLERSGILTAGAFSANATLELITSGGDIDYVPPDMRLRDSDMQVIESFESSLPWTAGQEGIVIEPADDFVSRGGRALSVTYPAVPDGFYLDLIGMETRLAGSKQLRLDIYCVGSYAEFSLEMEDAFGNYFSSGSRFLGHGWNVRIFDFTNVDDWEGNAITKETLANLTWVGIRVVCKYPGRLIFDGLSGAGVSLRGAARGSGLLSLSYSPNPHLEFIAETRVEDTYYGRTLDAISTAGAEGYLDNACFRFDVGEFRSSLMYRRRITALDQPIYHLLSPYSLGKEIAAVEVAGRMGKTEVQLLTVSRLEYEEYSSRVPTGFGPEGVVGLRCRRDISEGFRLGATALNHRGWFGEGVEIPENRQTYGLDLERILRGEKAAINLKLEGGVTAGDRELPEPNSPGSERFFLATRVAPEIGRLKFNYGYSHFGYGFDGTFATYGPNWSGHDSLLRVDLEDLWIFRHLSDLPIYDGSLANGLAYYIEFYNFGTRDYFLDAAGNRHPRSFGFEARTRIENDYKARPHFRLGVDSHGFADQWYRDVNVNESLRVRVPLYGALVLSGQGLIGQGMERDRDTGEYGTDVRSVLELGLERYFKGNLFMHISGRYIRSRASWEDEWEEPDKHFRWSAGARQTLGANSLIEVDFGQPALKGMDYGVQDTINVLTVRARLYF